MKSKDRFNPRAYRGGFNSPASQPTASVCKGSRGKESSSFTIQVKAPKGDDPGQVTTGYYTLADHILTMTDSSGRPIRRATTGESFTCKIKPGDNHVAFAGQMTLEIRRTMRGENAPGAVKGFGREFDYEKWGWLDVCEPRPDPDPHR